MQGMPVATGALPGLGHTLSLVRDPLGFVSRPHVRQRAGRSSTGSGRCPETTWSHARIVSTGDDAGRGPEHGGLAGARGTC